MEELYDKNPVFTYRKAKTQIILCKVTFQKSCRKLYCLIPSFSLFAQRSQTFPYHPGPQGQNESKGSNFKGKLYIQLLISSKMIELSKLLRTVLYLGTNYLGLTTLWILAAHCSSPSKQSHPLCIKCIFLKLSRYFINFINKLI